MQLDSTACPMMDQCHNTAFPFMMHITFKVMDVLLVRRNGLCLSVISYKKGSLWVSGYNETRIIQHRLQQGHSNTWLECPHKITLLFKGKDFAHVFCTHKSEIKVFFFLMQPLLQLVYFRHLAYFEEINVSDE